MGQEWDSSGFRQPDISAAEALRSLLANATGPVFPFTDPGTPTGLRQTGLSIVLGIFGLLPAGMTVWLFSQGDAEMQYAGLCPLVMCGLVAWIIWSNQTQGKRHSQTGAAELFGGTRPPAVLAAVKRFHAATDVPLRIIVREHVEDPEQDAFQRFERLQSEGGLDARGVVFLFSARTGGYTIGLGPELARRVPALVGLFFPLVKFSQRKFAEGLAGCLDVLAPEVGRIFPAGPGRPRDPADVLDIETAERPRLEP